MIAIPRFRSPSFLGVFALALIGAFAIAPPPMAAAGPVAPGAPGDITPHRAAYKLSLHSARSSSQITAVRGAMSFEWADACEGWTTEQRFQLNFVYAEGNADEMTTSYATWEAKDGSAYRFNVRKVINGETDEEVRGDASYEKLNEDGTIVFVKPEARRQRLPKGVLFPSAHTVALLEKAGAGERFFSQLVFDGTDNQGAAQVSAVIAKPTGVTSKIASPLLKSGRVWPVRMAFFPADSDTDQPDYEMTVRLLGNGVAEGMRIDYGDFIVDAVLEKVEALVKSGC